MVIGLVLGAMASGQMLSRARARYGLYAVIGTGALTAGMFLLSTMNKDTSFVEAVGYILVVGFGIGVTLTTATVVVQNSTPYRLLGVATSVLQFFRTASGTLGFALLGALLRARFSWGLSEQLPAEVREGLLPGQIEAITANPQDYVGTKCVDDPAVRGDGQQCPRAHGGPLYLHGRRPSRRDQLRVLHQRGTARSLCACRAVPADAESRG